MKYEHDVQSIDFKHTALYQIVVQGAIDQATTEHLRGFQAGSMPKKNDKVFTTLTGLMHNPSQLSGILNTFYDMHTTVISVNILNEVKS